MSSRRTVLLLVVSSCLVGCGADAPGILVFINDIEQYRHDEPVVISRAELEKRLGSIESGLVPIAYTENGTAVPGQVDDLDGDGAWDDWALLLSFRPREETRVRVAWRDSTGLPKFKVRTNVRAEGARGREATDLLAPTAVSWENDMVGFRLALGQSSGKQVLGKITTDMVLDSIAAAGSPNEMNLWGMYIPFARTSLGAGALAMWADGNLVRPPTGAGAQLKLLSEGPARSIFEVQYPGWKFGAGSCDLTERITIWAGRPGFESTVTVTASERDQEFAAGIARSQTDTTFQGNWGTAYQAIAAHGGFGTGRLGLALLYKSDGAAGVGEAGPSSGVDAVTDSYYVRFHVAEGAPSTHYLYAVWEQQNYRWGDRATFESLLQDEARRLSSPIRLR